MENLKTTEMHPPIRLNFDLSDGCNLRCVMCGGGKGYKNRNVIKIELFKNKILPFFQFVDDFQFGCRKEPLMTPYYSEALGLIKPFLKPNVKGWAITNGMLLSECNIQAIIDSDIYDTFRISFDGASKTVFENIRRGAKFEIVIKNIKNLVGYRNQRQSNTKIGLLFTIMRSNIQELPDLIKLAASLGVDQVTTHQLSPDDSNFVDKEYLKVLHENMDKANVLSKLYDIDFYGTIYRTRDEYEKIILDSESQIAKGIAYCGMLLPLKTESMKELRNSDGKITFVLDSLGNLKTPCLQMGDELVGNLLNSSYKEIICNQKFLKLLKYINKVDPVVCGKCHMLRCNDIAENRASKGTASLRNHDVSVLGSQAKGYDKLRLKLKSPTKILLPRFDSNGDLILFEGFIQALLDRFPHAEITLLVREGYEQLAPIFSPRLRWMTTSFNPYNNAPYKDLHLISKLLEKISKEKWDLIIFGAFSRVFIDELIAAKISTACKIAFEGRNEAFPWPKALLNKLDLPDSGTIDIFVPTSEGGHETEKYAVLWATIFQEYMAPPLPRLAVTNYLKTVSSQALNLLGLDGKDFVVCLPAGTDNIRIKQWPVERYAEVLLWLHKNSGYQPLIVGHEKETEIMGKLHTLLKERGVTAVMWCGKPGELSLMASIISKASMYIGNDSGPMHIANALDIPTVGIFGGGHWPRFKLKGSRAISVYSYLPCYYCLWDCIFDDALCIKLVAVEDVKKAITAILSCNDSAPSEFNVAYAVNEFNGKAMTKFQESHSTLRRKMQKKVLGSLTEKLAKCDQDERVFLEKLIEETRNRLSWQMTKPVRRLITFVKKVLS